MSRFIETIRFEHGEFQLLELHQERVDRTFQEFFPAVVPLDLRKILNGPNHGEKLKVRVEYDSSDFVITKELYRAKEISSLEMVESSINYEFKYAHRMELDTLLSASGADEIVIVKNGLITDTSYSNLAFFDGHIWVTPKSPLLSGVRRSDLLNREKMEAKDVRPADLGSFKKVSLINAMLDLDEHSFPVSSIT